MDIFDSRYFIFNKRSLLCFGIWSYQKTWQKVFLQIFNFSAIVSTLYLQVNFLISTWGHNINDVLECIYYIIIYIMCFCQCCLYSFNQDKLLFLLTCIKNDWKLWASGDDFKILCTYANTGRIITTFYFGYLSSAFVCNVMMAFTPSFLDIIVPLNESRPLKPVFPVKFPLDEKKYFQLIMVHNFFSSAYALAFFCACDTMFVVTTQHACGLFAIIRYVQKLEAIYSPYMFVALGCNVLTISFGLFQTMIMMGNWKMVLRVSCIVLVAFVHLIILGIPGQDLINESSNIAIDMYDCEWHRLPIKIQKLLPFVIMMGSVPCRLSIGRFATLNMETVGQIIKASFSYFTMMCTISQSRA